MSHCIFTCLQVVFDFFLNFFNDSYSLVAYCLVSTTVHFSSVVSCLRLFATPWTAGHQAPLSFTISWSLLKFNQKWDEIETSLWLFKIQESQEVRHIEIGEMMVENLELGLFEFWYSNTCLPAGAPKLTGIA